MLQSTLEQFMGTVSGLEKDLAENFDFNAIETKLCKALNDLVDHILQPLLQKILNSITCLALLKKLAARCAMRFSGYKETSVQIFTGRSLTLRSPYFVKAAPKDKKRKLRRGPNGTGSHLGLQALGFMARASANLASRVIQLAILCPSFKIAQQVLGEQGVNLDVKAIQRLCEKLGAVALPDRAKLSVDQEARDLSGLTVLICFDGGRLRQRKAKGGAKPAHLKRQGYHTDWVEPKLFTIQFLDKNGKLCKDITPFYDATLGKIDAAFELLFQHLSQINLASAERVVFCADGAPSIWKRVPALMRKLSLSQWHEVLDYTHAKQNLHEILGLLPGKISPQNRAEVTTYFKDLLWSGELETLKDNLVVAFHGKKREKALKKFRNYFEKNQHRMRYSTFKEMNLPMGSGAVESAIRRVINLRLKGPGIFWKENMAEIMLFLRCQLLSGRWSIMFNNIISATRNQLCQDCYPQTQPAAS